MRIGRYVDDLAQILYPLHEPSTYNTGIARHTVDGTGQPVTVASVNDNGRLRRPVRREITVEVYLCAVVEVGIIIQWPVSEHRYFPFNERISTHSFAGSLSIPWMKKELMKRENVSLPSSSPKEYLLHDAATVILQFCGPEFKDRRYAQRSGEVDFLRTVCREKIFLTDRRSPCHGNYFSSMLLLFFYNPAWFQQFLISNAVVWNQPASVASSRLGVLSRLATNDFIHASDPCGRHHAGRCPVYYSWPPS